MKKICLALTGVLCLMLVGCEDSNSNAKFIQENIVGTWKVTKRDGVTVTTNERSIKHFTADGKYYYTTSRANLGVWHARTEFSYTIDDNIIHTRSTDGTTTSTITVKSLANDVLTILCASTDHEFNVFSQSSSEQMRVNVDYSKSIIGTWEGRELIGDTTYGDYKHRWQYFADGSYIYYVQNEQQQWVPSANTENEYVVDGDYLACRWRDANRVEYREWWDLDRCDSIMKWSALREREDGTRYVTSFKMEKVPNL